MIDKTETIEKLLINQVDSQLIQTALDKLPILQKEAIILRFYQDLKVKEIAKITGVGVATAQSRIHQGLKKLASYLNEEEFRND